jgi:chemotaxis family two-component system response regulator Rcp1
MNSNSQFSILLVEDDPADQKLIKTSLEKQKVKTELNIASSAEEALDFLHHGADNGESNAYPDLILLDLNMPGMGGREFLKQVKTDEELKHISVVILTSSNSEKDIVESYELQAAGFVRKPVTLGELEQVAEAIQAYWFGLCRLPQKGY